MALTGTTRPFLLEYLPPHYYPFETRDVFPKWIPLSGINYTVEHYFENVADTDFTLGNSVVLQGTSLEQINLEAESFYGFRVDLLRYDTSYGKVIETKFKNLLVISLKVM